MIVSEQTGMVREGFAALSGRRSNAPQWLQTMRQRAMDRFEALGWPGPRDEAWRFTSTKLFSNGQFVLPVRGPVMNEEVIRACLPDCAVRLVFVNGIYQESLSLTGNLPDGIRLLPMSEALETESTAFESRLNACADPVNDAFTALNTALFEEGVYVDVDQGVVCEETIQVVHVHVGGEEAVMIHPRNLIVAKPNSRFSLAETHLSPNGGVCFTNSVTEVLVGEGAGVTHYLSRLDGSEALHVSNLRVRQSRDSSFTANSLLLGGKLVRNNVYDVFDGPNAEAEVNGLFVGQGKQHMDNDITIDHAQPHCRSNQFFKGILDGRSHGVFTGRIVVQPDAQKTDSAQSNRNLLLSEDARIDARPVLEIYADDVKCAHGATTGQIDEDALFYLQTRGIDPVSAMDLLTYAFAHEVIDRMPLETIQRQAEAFLFQRFSKAKMIEES